jgi:hypothetical protein
MPIFPLRDGKGPDRDKSLARELGFARERGARASERVLIVLQHWNCLKQGLRQITNTGTIAKSLFLEELDKAIWQFPNLPDWFEGHIQPIPIQVRAWVQWFATVMEREQAKRDNKHGREGWTKIESPALVADAQQHLPKLWRALRKREHEEVIAQCANIANLLSFVAARAEMELQKDPHRGGTKAPYQCGKCYDISDWPRNPADIDVECPHCGTLNPGWDLYQN